MRSGVVLKVQGGELKTIARKDVDEQFTSKVSLMPEDLEKQFGRKRSSICCRT